MFELDKDEVIKVLTRNAIKCLVCNTVLESSINIISVLAVAITNRSLTGACCTVE